MKILILNPTLYSANSYPVLKVKSIKDCMIYSFCLAFQSLGHTVTLIAAKDYQPEFPENYDFDIIFMKAGLKKIFPIYFPFLTPLPTYLRKKGKSFDLIITSETFAIHSLLSVIFCKKNTLVWQELNEHNRMFYKIPSKLWYNTIGRLFFKNTLIIPRSEPAYYFIRQFCNTVSPTPVDHGINLKKFVIQNKKEKQFIVVAQLIKRKNIDYIIRQFSTFIQKYPQENYRLIIAGRGTEEEHLKALVSQLKMESAIHFVGFLNHSELNRYISQSIATLIATTNDLNMVSIPESIVSGTPILSNTIPALCSYIVRNCLGICKENWGIEELELMVKEQQKFFENCIQKRDDLSSENSAKRIIEAYQKFNDKSSNKR